MRVARYAIALIAAIQLGSPALAAQDEAYVPPADELALARVIIEAMFPADRRDQMTLNMSETVTKQFAGIFMKGPIYDDPGIKAIMDRFLADLPNTMRPIFAASIPQLLDANAIAYTRRFTLAELQDIAAFAQTPSGQSYFMSLQSLLNDPDIARANQAVFETGRPVIEQEARKVRQEVEAYFTANPDALERIKKASEGKAN